MWPFRQKSPDDIPTFEVQSTIGTGTRVLGDLKGPGGFRIDGTVEGAVESDGPVVVGEGGTVEGSVHGRDVVILGAVRGDVQASGHLEIGPKGKVIGDMSVGSFRMHKGGVFRGTSRMPTGEDPKPAASPLALPTAPRAALLGADGARALEARRGRTLPPPNGAVVPPPSEGVVSQERLITSDDDADDQATGT
jgi:cytoskeletal protein CcmA (bactofilin family)